MIIFYYVNRQGSKDFVHCVRLSVSEDRREMSCDPCRLNGFF